MTVRAGNRAAVGLALALALAATLLSPGGGAGAEPTPPRREAVDACAGHPPGADCTIQHPVLVADGSCEPDERGATFCRPGPAPGEAR